MILIDTERDKFWRQEEKVTVPGMDMRATRELEVPRMVSRFRPCRTDVGHAFHRDGDGA